MGLWGLGSGLDKVTVPCLSHQGVAFAARLIRFRVKHGRPCQACPTVPSLSQSRHPPQSAVSAQPGGFYSIAIGYNFRFDWHA